MSTYSERSARYDMPAAVITQIKRRDENVYESKVASVILKTPTPISIIVPVSTAIAEALVQAKLLIQFISTQS
ncbi:hypothetical protein FRC12_004905 [Ceratobasidium sp. 428]|nr:hypothetical protein FRC12_004905 [Ceratobasidium sp. 428]